MEETLLLALVQIARYLGAALVMGLGSVGPALAQGKIGAAACENLGKYPESTSAIRTAMYVGLGMVESSAVYCLVVAMVLIFFV